MTGIAPGARRRPSPQATVGRTRAHVPRCIPHCPRWRWLRPGEHAVEYICPSHWRTVPLPRRKTYERWRKALGESPDPINRAVGWRLWCSLKRTVLGRIIDVG